jgi:predicted DNA-binding protein
MAFAKQDGNQAGLRALSEMEGKMLVLEVVAMTSLALALDTSDPENARIGRGVLYLMREAVENKCEEMDFSAEAAASAQQYVEELLHTAMATLFPERH